MSKKIKVLFATTNEGKLKEVKEIAREEDFEIIGLSEVGLGKVTVMEDGKTFLENARKKAIEFSLKVHLPVVADDSGLEIDALNGEPGVHSARYLGETLSFEDKCKIILKKMGNTSDNLRTARFICFACYAREGNIIHCAKGVLEGKISTSLKGNNGFGYDPIFYYPPFKKTLAQMELEEKNRISHRTEAFKQLFFTIKRYNKKFNT